MSIDNLLVDGANSLRAGDPRTALTVLGPALTQAPTDARVLALVALAHFRSGEYTRARPLYATLVQLEPDDMSHRFNLGLVCLKLGDAETAIRELERARGDEQFAFRATSNLGLAYAVAERFEQAYRMFMTTGQASLAREVASKLDDATRARLERDAAPSAISNNSMSTQFVLAAPDQSMRTAMATAGPSAAALAPVVEHSNAPVLAAFAQQHGFGRTGAPVEVLASGELVLRMAEGFCLRMQEVAVITGAVEAAVIERRVRGQKDGRPFDGVRPMMLAQGVGTIIAAPRGQFVALRVDSQPLYVVGDALFGFSARLVWENGFVPGTNQQREMVQLRGEGDVVLATAGPLRALPVDPAQETRVRSDVLIGWSGNVMPRAEAGGAAEYWVSFRGEGWVLIAPGKFSS